MCTVMSFLFGIQNVRNEKLSRPFLAALTAHTEIQTVVLLTAVSRTKATTARLGVNLGFFTEGRESTRQNESIIATRKAAQLLNWKPKC